MFKLQYYCKSEGTEVILKLLAEVKAKHNIPYEISRLSNEEQEKQVYEKDFKPKAKLLRRNTGKPITKLRSRRARHYFVSNPGTIAIIRDGEIEWWTLGNEGITEFLKRALSNGHSFLEECRK